MPTKKLPAKKNTKNNNPDIQILSVEICPTVSGSSTLKYQIGKGPDSGIYIKIMSSSGSGFVNPTWYSLNMILNVLTAHSVKIPIKSSIIKKGLELGGRSRNDSAFIVATLIANEILVPFEGEEKYQWKLNSADTFLAKVEQLKSGNTKKSTRKKTP